MGEYGEILLLLWSIGQPKTNNIMNKLMQRVWLMCVALAVCGVSHAGIRQVRKLNSTTIELLDDKGVTTTIDFYGPNIFRLFQDPKGGIVRDPVASPPAKILVDNPRRKVQEWPRQVDATGDKISIATEAITLYIDPNTMFISVKDNRTGKIVLTQTGAFEYTDRGASFTLASQPDEYFYGGGVQNGRFSHRGTAIQIVNTNNWTDGGVASPTPFYWSTKGYSMMWHTFAPGKYDFGAAKEGAVTLSHETDYVDVFFSVSETPVALLNDFYQLTGNPVLLPKFGFYEGHLNAYNRDFWKESDGAGEGAMGMVGKDGSVLFEDGKYYKESQTNNGGTQESLNGEKDNYQFSARAVIDRYIAADMPLGWVLPNDGYGAGYGQTGTLEGNVQNLKEFGDYARSKGIEIGLWTQSDLHPKEGIEPLLQRDIVREVRDAGVRVLKTDVAWVGAGYSFGLNGVADVGRIMPYYGNEARPFIISLDGWAGTQRYAGIWSGDQTGGEWEYIRFHIPTYIGSGLSGQPNICSDMDGIFGGKNIPVNVRDFQWKTFSPMQLNMDGWGANPKYPQALGEKAASINRHYLKLKAMLMPYTYSIAHEAIDGKPMLRAMMLDYPNDYTLGTATRYQFMYGPYILVAPIYQNTRMDSEGNDIRNGIYLPEGEWYDANTGKVFEGGVILNNYPAPIENLPHFYKVGAIIPMTAPHNNPNEPIADKFRQYTIVPGGHTYFTEYDDDGRTQAYLYGEQAYIGIEQSLNEKGQLTVKLGKAQGSFVGMAKSRVLSFQIITSAAPKKVQAKLNGKKVAVVKSEGMEQTAFYNYSDGLLNVFFPNGYTTSDDVELTIDGVALNKQHTLLNSHGALTAPKAQITDENTMSYTVTPSWEKVPGADFYEIEFEGMRYSTITDTQLLFEDLTPVTDYKFKVRAVNADGASDWTALSVTTKPDPLRHAIRGIRAETTCENQGGQGIDKLFDFDEARNWHTAWGKNAVPFDITVDLRTVNVLDKLQYMPRPDGGNGVLLKGSIAWSMDKSTWNEETAFDWERNGEVKEFTFASHPTARYLKIHVEEGVGGFGSGQEMYIFRVEGSEYYIPGDVNHDNRIDENDLTSYMNYTGLRSGDPDFEGYMNQGDLDKNGLIDAYDISAVAIELESGVSSRKVSPIECRAINVNADKATVKAGDVVTLTVEGLGMVSVNAISLAIPYDATKWEYAGIDACGTKEMRNLTYDRLHSNGNKALYPTFVNCGEHPYLEGDATIMRITFKAKAAGKVDLKAQDVIVVDKYLNKK
ncbi:MAG: discoidin domain-containing protein [Bacteroidaceae bacterium]|nr:discoidin domain-containing protein [Bacteroidaceae bacterium]